MSVCKKTVSTHTFLYFPAAGPHSPVKFGPLHCDCTCEIALDLAVRLITQHEPLIFTQRHAVIGTFPLLDYSTQAMTFIIFILYLYKHNSTWLVQAVTLFQTNNFQNINCGKSTNRGLSRDGYHTSRSAVVLNTTTGTHLYYHQNLYSIRCISSVVIKLNSDDNAPQYPVTVYTYT
ncbi:hypothetical protein EB796_004276 [Bugula neritina]|uniref:Uncharacterized protein n=1 Tax=Bugula neritina TaxID=10212 RepID=A0A7J7KGN9_BUGNE|nr:hypothetical protein EB796_004276 [Bugula neritina]